MQHPDLVETCLLFLFSFLFNQTGDQTHSKHSASELYPQPWLWGAATGRQGPNHLEVLHYPLEMWILKGPLMGFKWSRDPSLPKNRQVPVLTVL